MIEIFDDIRKGLAREVRQVLKASPGKRVDVLINSCGGNHLESMAVFNLIVAHGNCRTVNLGVAASAAATIFLAGKTRLVTPGSLTMVHLPWTEAGIGTANDLRRSADDLDRAANQLAELIARQTGQRLPKVNELLSATTWLEDREAVAMGFAHQVSAEFCPALTKHSLDRFKNAPTAIMARKRRVSCLDQWNQLVASHRRRGLSPMAARAEANRENPALRQLAVLESNGR